MPTAGQVQRQTEAAPRNPHSLGACHGVSGSSGKQLTPTKAHYWAAKIGSQKVVKLTKILIDQTVEREKDEPKVKLLHCSVKCKLFLHALFGQRVQRPGFEVQISDVLIRQPGLTPKSHRWQDTSSTKTIQVTVTFWDKPKTSLSRQKWNLQGIMGLPEKNSKHFWCLFWNVSCFNSLKVRSFFCYFGWFQSLSNLVSHFRSWFLMRIYHQF